MFSISSALTLALIRNFYKFFRFSLLVNLLLLCFVITENKIRKEEGKIQLKIKDLSKYQDIKVRKSFQSDQGMYVNNVPLSILVDLEPNQESKQVEMDIYLSVAEIENVFKITSVFFFYFISIEKSSDLKMRLKGLATGRFI
jgi:hypothetical protein